MRTDYFMEQSNTYNAKLNGNAKLTNFFYSHRIRIEKFCKKVLTHTHVSSTDPCK